MTLVNGYAGAIGAQRARLGHVVLAVLLLAGSADLADDVLKHRNGGWLGFGVAAVMLLSALVSGIAGFAFAALAGSALAWLKIDPVQAVQSMVLCTIATQAYAVWRIRDAVRWAGLWPMIAAGALTIPLGVFLLVRTPHAVYALGLGVFLTAYGAYVLMRGGSRPANRSAWSDKFGSALAGALGGLVGGLAGMPGSIVTIWCSLRGGDKLQQRAVYQPYILMMQVITLAWLNLAAPITAQARHDLRFVPFALLGAMAGLAIFQRMTNGQFHVAVSVLLIVSGAGLLGRGL